MFNIVLNLHQYDAQSEEILAPPKDKGGGFKHEEGGAEGHAQPQNVEPRLNSMAPETALTSWQEHLGETHAFTCSGIVAFPPAEQAVNKRTDDTLGFI